MSGREASHKRLIFERFSRLYNTSGFAVINKCLQISYFNDTHRL
uniref:Uncharacterized protein n=1 Tax=Parascaris equorum TaxID=6256 RepID=A0A914S6M0_PAREQ